MREYFCTAKAGNGEVAFKTLKAYSFDEAARNMEAIAEEEFGIQTYRITSVIEQPIPEETMRIPVLELHLGSTIRMMGTKTPQGYAAR